MWQKRPMCGVNTVWLQYLPKQTVIIKIISYTVAYDSYFKLLLILAPFPDSSALSRPHTFMSSSVLKANPVVVWIRSWKPEIIIVWKLKEPEFPPSSKALSKFQTQSDNLYNRNCAFIWRLD